MNRKEKLVRQWYAKGRIRRLGSNTFSVPVDAFVLGITPRLINEILSTERRERNEP